MMEKLLVLTHVDETGELTKASLEAVAAGVEFSGALGASLGIGMVGATTGAVTKQVAGCGATVLTVTGEAFAQARYASDAAACEALCRAAEATLVFAPANSRFARVLPGVAYRLGGAADTHITALAKGDGLEATRWFYRQRVEAVLRRTTRPWFLLLEAGTRESYSAAEGEPKSECVAVV